MQNKGKSVEHLKLQSYKVDSQILASKINELNDLKSQLQNTLSKQRSQQNSIFDQLEQLKAQNQRLRAAASDLQFTKKSQSYLIQQLEKRLESAQNKALTYSKRLDQEQQEKQSIKDFYERKLSALGGSIGLHNLANQANQYETSKVTEYSANSLPHHPFTMSGKTISSIDQSSKCDSNKKIKRLKKPSIQQSAPMRPSLQIANKYKSPNVIVEKEEDSHLSGQDVYLQMIRQLYKQLLKIQIRGNDLLKIPQIEAFSRLRNPSKNDLAKLCRSYPFHINQAHKIDLIFEFMNKESQRKGVLLNGKFVIEQIIQQIEQIDCSQDPRSQDDMSLQSIDQRQRHNTFQIERSQNFADKIEYRTSQRIKKLRTDSEYQNDSENSNYY